jgi:crotonobetainyl-CoA:carnitine CoA-transferase CaiB-like acyl-CoA transferase
MSAKDDPPRPLKVIDLTNGIAGPFCTMLLGDMGADVIKVEKPPTGDDFRAASPVVQGESFYFFMVNRNKRSIGLDLKSEKGREILLRLVKDADVVVENYRPGTAERLGIGYDQVSELNGRVVYCSISGFGQDGPYRERAAFDLIAQAMSGTMSLTGDSSPLMVGSAIADFVSGLYGAFAISSALLQRGIDGKGQHIDVAMLDAMMTMMGTGFAQFLGSGKVPTLGYRSKIIVPFGPFRASDGEFVLEAASDGTWKRFVDVLQDPRLESPDFRGIQDRVRNRERLMEILGEVLAKDGKADWVEKLSRAGVPCAPIYNLAEVAADAQVKHRQMITTVKHKKLGDVRILSPAVKMSGKKVEVRLPPPVLGQDNVEVLSSIGMGTEEIERLISEGVVFPARPD